MEEKQRLDVRLVRMGLATSREKAKEWIKAGQVKCSGRICNKAGMMVGEEELIEVLAQPLRYVSRGGLKLEKALQAFKICIEGQICLDAGASTGGFTDCMLQNGAAKVYAVDVGHDQLAEKLRQDARVISMENTNVKELSPELLAQLCDFASADLSFISLEKVLPAIAGCLRTGGQLVCLIKPQFEAGKDKVGKKGVVKDAKVHKQVLTRITSFCEGIGLAVNHLTTSPILGQEGNREFLVHLTKRDQVIMQKGVNEKLPVLIEQVVREAHKKSV